MFVDLQFQICFMGHMWMPTGAKACLWMCILTEFSQWSICKHPGERSHFCAPVYTKCCGVCLSEIEKSVLRHHVHTQQIETLYLCIFSFYINRKFSFSASCVNPHIWKQTYSWVFCGYTFFEKLYFIFGMKHIFVKVYCIIFKYCKIQ